MYFRWGCVGANDKVDLTRVDNVVVFGNICMSPSLQEGSRLLLPNTIFNTLRLKFSLP